MPEYKARIDSQIPEMLFRSSLVYRKGLGAKPIPERKRVEERWMTYTHTHLCTVVLEIFGVGIFSYTEKRTKIKRSKYFLQQIIKERKILRSENNTCTPS